MVERKTAARGDNARKQKRRTSSSWFLLPNINHIGDARKPHTISSFDRTLFMSSIYQIQPSAQLVIGHPHDVHNSTPPTLSDPVSLSLLYIACEQRIDHSVNRASIPSMAKDQPSWFVIFNSHSIWTIGRSLLHLHSI